MTDDQEQRPPERVENGSTAGTTEFAVGWVAVLFALFIATRVLVGGPLEPGAAGVLGDACLAAAWASGLYCVGRGLAKIGTGILRRGGAVLLAVGLAVGLSSCEALDQRVAVLDDGTAISLPPGELDPDGDGVVQVLYQGEVVEIPVASITTQGDRTVGMVARIVDGFVPLAGGAVVAVWSAFQSIRSARSGGGLGSPTGTLVQAAPVYGTEPRRVVVPPPGDPQA